jgi:hypothetical protein
VVAVTSLILFILERARGRRLLGGRAPGPSSATLTVRGDGGGVVTWTAEQLGELSRPAQWVSTAGDGLRHVSWTPASAKRR